MMNALTVKTEIKKDLSNCSWMVLCVCLEVQGQPRLMVVCLVYWIISNSVKIRIQRLKQKRAEKEEQQRFTYLSFFFFFF